MEAAEAGKKLFANVQVTPEGARRFVEALAKDDDFRAQVEANPEDALARHGVHVPPGQIKKPVTLPAKEQLEELLERRDEAVWVFIAFIAFIAFINE